MQTRYEYLRSIAHGGGSTKGALTCGFLKTILIPMPPLAEQNEIASTFHALDAKLLASRRKQAVFQQLFQVMLNQLMSTRISTKKEGESL